VRAKGALLSLLLISWAATAQTPPQPFELPVNCDLEQLCSLQLYVDHDPSDAYEDYSCGGRTYNGSIGTDIRVPNFVEMDAGITVVAAAPGTVKAVRDGMQDISVAEIGKEALQGRHAGNGVVIDHGGAWETQYSHLKKGSVAVAKGDIVEAGTPLGEIGLSGNTNFPHMEFAVRFQGEIVDPFVGVTRDWRCGEPRAPLWSSEALAALRYRDAVLLNAGFAPERAEQRKAERGRYSVDFLPADSPALTFWVHYFGGRLGDERHFWIVRPDGSVLHEHNERVEKTRYTDFLYVGKKRPDGSWPPGLYRGIFHLNRGEEQILKVVSEIEIR